MKATIRTTFASVLAGALGAAAAGSAAAQAYPTKPIRFVVPFAPGGGADIVVRALAPRLSERLGQAVVVENRAGAGGTIGTEIAVRAAGDGYTLLLANVAPVAITVSIRKLPYDPVRDLTPITRLATFPNVLVVHPSIPAKSLAELVALARARPGDLNYASAGIGSTTHLSAELLKQRAGIDMVHIVYKGGGPALTDLLGGQVTLYFGSMPAALPHVRAGRLRALAVTSLERSAAAPQLPSVAEQGYPGFEAVTWIGVVAPAGVPWPIVDRLNAELVRTTALPEIREALQRVGAEPGTSTPDAFARYIRSEIDKWAKVVKDAGLAAR